VVSFITPGLLYLDYTSLRGITKFEGIECWLSIVEKLLRVPLIAGVDAAYRISSIAVPARMAFLASFIGVRASERKYV